MATSPTVQAVSLKNPARAGSPDAETVRRALQAQTALSGQVVKTIRAYFYHLMNSVIQYCYLDSWQ
jgi:hypothetical protein